MVSDIVSKVAIYRNIGISVYQKFDVAKYQSCYISNYQRFDISNYRISIYRTIGFRYIASNAFCLPYDSVDGDMAGRVLKCTANEGGMAGRWISIWALVLAIVSKVIYRNFDISKS